MKKILLLTSLLFSYTFTNAQEEVKEEKGTLSGNLTANNQFFLRDDKIGANTELYTRYLSGTESWLNLNYGYKGFNFNARFDVFNNSNLFNPSQAYSNSGVGFWQITKDIDNINITAGYFYEQFATGTIFRAFEDRNLGLDYAVQGVRVKYKVTDNLSLKAFTGKQKFRFGLREPILKGFNAEYTWNIKDLKIESGASIFNRTMDAHSMELVVNTINNQPAGEQFYPKYNLYVSNLYSSFIYKKFRLYAEVAHKTPEAIKNTVKENGPLELNDGNVYYVSATYSTKGLGINAQYKRIERFPVRTSPNEITLDGVMNYLPSITRQNTYRLLARYNAVVQELGEHSFQADLVYTYKSPKKLKTQVNLNYSKVISLQNVLLFEEIYADVSKEFSKKFKVILGLQNIQYNQRVYESKPDYYPFVHALTPFGEFNYKITKTKTIRTEWQYLKTKQDQGSFINVLVEYSIAPHWSFAAGDMVNIDPVRFDKTIAAEKLHYYQFFAAYTEKATRFTLSFVKQLAGVNCTGGVCRVEPAFSGIRFTCSTSF